MWPFKWGKNPQPTANDKVLELSNFDVTTGTIAITCKQYNVSKQDFMLLVYCLNADLPLLEGHKTINDYGTLVVENNQIKLEEI